MVTAITEELHELIRTPLQRGAMSLAVTHIRSATTGEEWVEKEVHVNHENPYSAAKASTEVTAGYLVRGLEGAVQMRGVSYRAACSSQASLFLRMEYVKGRSLRDCINDENISIHEKIGYLYSTGRALIGIHERGVTHTDLKPDNIMVTQEGKIKILDFGLARHKHAGELCKPENTLGTPSYMAPEQTKGKKLSPGTDYFALGIMFYETITRTHPFADLADRIKDVESLFERCAEHKKIIEVDATTQVIKALQKPAVNRLKTIAKFDEEKLDSLAEYLELCWSFMGYNADRVADSWRELMRPSPDERDIIPYLEALEEHLESVGLPEGRIHLLRNH